MEKYSQYAEFTNAQDWKAICSLNGVEFDSFGTKKELRVLSEYLEPDEVVFALTSGLMSQTETSNTFDFGTNTWLVVLTSDRFLFLDCAMLTKSVDSQSIRHNNVQAVSASQGLMLGKITIDLGSRTLVIDNCIKSTVKVIANIANKWLKELDERDTQPQSLGQPNRNSDLFSKLDLVQRLFEMGGLSQEELDRAKHKVFSSKEYAVEKEKLLSSL